MLPRLCCCRYMDHMGNIRNYAMNPAFTMHVYMYTHIPVKIVSNISFAYQCPKIRMRIFLHLKHFNIENVSYMDRYICLEIYFTICCYNIPRNTSLFSSKKSKQHFENIHNLPHFVIWALSYNQILGYASYSKVITEKFQSFNVNNECQ